MEKVQSEKMVERFFKKANELQEVATSSEGFVDFEQLLDQLNIEFAMMCDEFKIANENERNKEQEINVKHVFYRVGLNLVERLLDIEPTSDIPCAQREQQPADGSGVDEQAQSVENEHQPGQNPPNQQRQQDQPDEAMTVDPENASALLKDVPSCEMPLQLAYKDFVQLIDPIFSFKAMETASERSMKLLICAIEGVQKHAKELGYSLDNDERALVVYIHAMLDEVSQELWTWEVMDKVAPTLQELIHFLNKRVERMNKTPVGSRSESRAESRAESRGEPDWAQPSTSYGISNPPKRQRKLTTICINCKGDHGLCQCGSFIGSSLQAKAKLLQQKRLCINCFSAAHAVSECPMGPCKKCNLKHNSLMCPKNPKNY